MTSDVIDIVGHWVEILGALMISAGIAIAVFRVARVPFMARRPPLAAVQIRLGLGMSLALGLEFLLAADILRTAVAPTWDEIGQLAAIAAIRTGLNYFLGREFMQGLREIDVLDAARLDTWATGPPSSGLQKKRGGPTPPPVASPSEIVRHEPARTNAPQGQWARWAAALKGPVWRLGEPPPAP